MFSADVAGHDCSWYSSDSVRHPRAWDILFKATWKHLPGFVLGLVKYIPTREYTRFRKTRLVIEGMAQELVDEKREAYLAGDGKNKDILSILGGLSLSARYRCIINTFRQ